MYRVVSIQGDTMRAQKNAPAGRMRASVPGLSRLNRSRPMRSLLAAILSLFLPPRGAHRGPGTPPFLTVCPPVPAHQPAPARRPRPHPADVIAADGLPLVRPYLAVWEH